MVDFFISYNRADQKWAEWIAWQLEEAGYAVIVQAWDIRPGSNFILEMDKAARETERTIAVLSLEYLKAFYTRPEWAAAFIPDPTGEKKKLLPVRVQDFTPDGLLAAIVYIDLVGKDETEAQSILLSGVKPERAKPIQPPTFPQSDQRCVPEQPQFPSVPQSEKKEKRWFSWASASEENLETRNRLAMLDKVRQSWITGVLQQSLYNEVMITLGLAERPTAVARPLDVLVQRPDGTDRPLPAETKIGEVFEELQGSLLILGTAGSGKTTLLLELARDLLDYADQNSGFPIPVVFPLSTWGEQRLPLAEWLIDELAKRYDVPQKVARAWIEQDRVLPLLDGLDEVKEEYRAACVEAINDFRKEHGFLLPLAVCCRAADYEAIGKQLRLQGAILVQPLIRQQVEMYLDQLGESGTAVRKALREDQTLWELAESPLLLNIMILAYRKESDDLPYAGTTPEAQRQHLFTVYVNRMFQRRSSTTHYTKEQTLHWLSWLAQQMLQYDQTIFYIKRLQPEFLLHGQRWQATRGVALVFTLASGLAAALSVGLLYGVSVGLLRGVIIGPFDGLVSGVSLFLAWTIICWPIFVLAMGLIKKLKNINLEPSRWSLSAFESKYSFCVMTWGSAGVLTGLCGGLSAGLSSILFGRSDGGLLTGGLGGAVLGAWVFRWSGVLSNEQYSRIIGGLGGGLSAILVALNSDQWDDTLIGALLAGLAVGLLLGLTLGGFLGLCQGLMATREIEMKSVPDQGIWRLARNALLVGSIAGLAHALMLILARRFDDVIPGSLGTALIFGMSLGGFSCLKHLVLRLLLVWQGSAPWCYASFLDYGAERVFFRKVGGGYMFIHRLLLEHFAALEAKEVIRAANTEESAT